MPCLVAKSGFCPELFPATGSIIYWLEVGLGKTIEAGLVIREFKLRGLVRRTLVVAPKGIATQWVAEMQTHFNEQFQFVLGEDIGTLQRLAPDSDQRSSPWSMSRYEINGTGRQFLAVAFWKHSASINLNAHSSVIIFLENTVI